MAIIYRVISEADLGLEEEAFSSESGAIAYMDFDDRVQDYLKKVEYGSVLEAINGGQITLMEMYLHD